MVKCPACGSENPNYSVYCGKCGSEIPDNLRLEAQMDAERQSGIPAYAETKPSEPVQQVTESKAQMFTPQEGMRKCEWCGAYNMWNANFCTNCGRNPRTGSIHVTEYSEPITMRHESGVPIIGGVFCILAGVAALAQGGIYLLADSLAAGLPSELTGYLCFCGGLDVLFGIGGVIAGIFSFQRRHWTLALIGAILSMLGLGFYIGALFGLIGIICVAASKSEFQE